MRPRDPGLALLYLAARAAERAARAVADALADPTTPQRQRLEIRFMADDTSSRPAPAPAPEADKAVPPVAEPPDVRLVGQRVTVAAFATSEDGFPSLLPGPVEWAVSEPAVLRLDSQGDGVGAARLTALAPGEATIRAKCDGLAAEVGVRVEHGPAARLAIVVINDPYDLEPPSVDGGAPGHHAGSWAFAATQAQLDFLARRGAYATPDGDDAPA